ncbi:hypothetical protein ES708_33654 [subsurface metagenome]
MQLPAQKTNLDCDVQKKSPHLKILKLQIAIQTFRGLKKQLWLVFSNTHLTNEDPHPSDVHRPLQLLQWLSVHMPLPQKQDGNPHYRFWQLTIMPEDHLVFHEVSATSSINSRQFHSVQLQTIPSVATWKNTR